LLSSTTRGLTAATLLVLAGSLAACGHAERAGGGAGRPAITAPRDVRAVGRYRIIGTPIAGVSTTGNGITNAIVTVRTNTALPMYDRSVAANIRLDGAGGVSPAIRAGDGRTHHCYVQPVEEFPRRARTGDQTALTIRIPGLRRQLRMTLTFAGRAQSFRRYRALCGPRKIFDDPDAAS
jgi:hypothetical protein